MELNKSELELSDKVYLSLYSTMVILMLYIATIKYKL